MERSAVFSPDRLHRYSLTRAWDVTRPTLNAVGLNPSTADETKDDPTVSRLITRAIAAGYGALIVTNLFSWRATDPRELRLVREPVGQDCEHFLHDAMMRATLSNGRVLLCWGDGGSLHCRAHVKTPHYAAWTLPLCLGLTKAGQPKHPLYLAANLPMVTLLEALSERAARAATGVTDG